MIFDLKKNIDNFVKTTINDKNDKNLNIFPLDCKYINDFRRQKLEERIKISQKIISKYPQRVPIIVDCKQEIILDKNKYIVPNDLTVAQFMYILKKRINVNEQKSIFLLCNNQLVICTESINSLFNRQKDYDGFLYIIISLENTFGN
jgi:GABA(A) receptor-associated protein